MDTQKAVICVLLIFIGIATLMIPFLRYVCFGWRAKRQDIMDVFTEDACRTYFEMFSPSRISSADKKVSVEFDRLYSKWYGRRLFWVPGLLLFLVGLIAVTLVVLTVLHTRGYVANPLFDVPNIGIAAIAGAYLWVVNDFISRVRRLDFAPSDVLWGVLRLIIAVPMGYSLATLAAESVGPFVAFALGAFPLATLTSMLQRLANKHLGVEPTAEETSDDIVKLQGINRWIIERLSNEDITTVTQIAYCDPIRLIMRSNLTFHFVTDCMNQALAWIYLKDGLDTIRPLGMRGAVEIKHFIDAFDYDDAKNTDPEHQAERKAAHDRAVSALPKIAATLNQEPETLQLVFREIARDPYAIYLREVWT